ncbi:MAG: addiction module protein [Phycisphaerae bacterium]
MTMNNKKLVAEIQKLSIDEQIDLVQDVWDGIAAHPEQVPLTSEQKCVLDKRLKEYKKDPAAAKPWEEVMERIRQRRR